MERSSLERFNDKILIKIIDNIIKDFDEINSEWSHTFENNEHVTIYESNIRALGVRPNLIDVDYISALMRLNYKNDFQIPLNRPSLALYEVNVNISERVIQTQTYEHNVYSYDSTNCFDKFRFEDQEGMISIYDGEITNTEVHDSESFDWDYLSPIKIKEF